MTLDMVYSQRDGRWAAVPLGTYGGTTIGGYGCYDTALAMVATRFGHPTTPPEMNALLIANGGYTGGNMVAGDGVLARVFDDIAAAGTIYYASARADLAKLKELCARDDLAVILEVDFNRWAPGVQTHFGVAEDVDVDPGEVTWADPWTGTSGPMSPAYGDPAVAIQKFVLYQWTGHPAAAAPLPDLAVDPALYEDAEMQGYFGQEGVAINMATALIQRAVLARKRGETRGPAISDEEPWTAADGTPRVRQRFTAGTGEYNPATGEVSWVELNLEKGH